ncbi:regulatory LuxR family protein [Motilibacter rhizosphaerae]|uniref:Regulatory LuxR family protein n=1 Tax=Motilibacter rhizosphaerae TaxID=598652 RepID=A0A4Q7NS74_9ACTN|nr:helix-turn-helix transcriptional regulator [Motilibacter rhizosphaerae]RZS89941.1 regulatory LuxR family protein [Motilibacter rhizosphaerae]
MQVPVWLSASDRSFGAEVARRLATCPEIRLLPTSMADRAAVAVVAARGLDVTSSRLVAAARARGLACLVVCGAVPPAGARQQLPAGVSLLPLVETGAGRLPEVVATLARGGSRGVPAQRAAVPRVVDLTARELVEVAPVAVSVSVPAAAAALPLAGGSGADGEPLREREVAVLRLVAEGFDTAEIARHLSYSERTVKGVLHDVTTRLELRNRSHAVAYALRRGLI